MITNDYLKGYHEALKHLEETLQTFIDAEQLLRDNNKTLSEEFEERVYAFEQVIQYITTVKNNYKQLVNKLNRENQ